MYTYHNIFNKYFFQNRHEGYNFFKGFISLSFGAPSSLLKDTIQKDRNN